MKGHTSKSCTKDFYVVNLVTMTKLVLMPPFVAWNTHHILVTNMVNFKNDLSVVNFAISWSPFVVSTIDYSSKLAVYSNPQLDPDSRVIFYVKNSRSSSITSSHATCAASLRLYTSSTMVSNHLVLLLAPWSGVKYKL